MINRAKLKPNPIKSSVLPRWRLFPLTTLFNRQWWWSTLLVLAAMAVMARLGFWQLDRLEQRRARNTEITHQLALPPLPLTGHNSLPDDLARLKTRLTTSSGKFDFSRQIALQYQNRMGAPGFHLITPLVFEDGSTAVLVDRGWLPQSEASPEKWSQFDEPELATVTGFIQLSETLPQNPSKTEPSALPVSSSGNAPQTEWYRVDIAAIQTQVPYKLLPVYIRQLPPEGENSDPPYRSEPEFDLSDGPHLGYAIQWYIFALILGIGYVRFVSKQVTNKTTEETV